MRAARALGQVATRSPLLARARPVARGWARAEMRVASPFSTIPVGAKPTIEDAKTMPREYYEMPNDVLLTLAASGDYGAKEEIMIREIMAVDGVSWQDAQPKFQEISAKAYEGKGVASLDSMAARTVELICRPFATTTTLSRSAGKVSRSTSESR